MHTRDLIDLAELKPSELQDILRFTGFIAQNPQYYRGNAEHKIMATLFYEPSTRTQMSFQAAMLRLGGRLIGFDDPDNSSVAKGESLKDTVRVISNYADVLVIRSPLEGAALAASLYSRCPVINAGDGGHLHPTQTLTDLATLDNAVGRLDHLTVGLCGDNLNGRTVHSLVKTLSRYAGNHFVMISTPELALPGYLLDEITRGGSTYARAETLEEAIPALDVLYMTRIQKERFASVDEYERLKDVFVLDRAKLKHAKSALRILHPLPRVNEIAVDVDDDPRATYFAQTEYGLYARMALLQRVLEHTDRAVPTAPADTHKARCTNERCVTSKEHYLPRLFKETDAGLVCRYCEQLSMNNGQ
ncbi:MAG: aspartate carbamoyltransferase [Oscillospiraceae bacterium]|jgi:aspartate carbamoyltransferase catalytic subunit|nr:aspartate carbamoyltransferase [Oscillospiraceae bacterium]